MPIEVTCSGCNRRLRVPDKAAGKRIKCPKCEGVINVPAAESSPKPSGGEKALKKATSLPKQESKWFVKTEDGETYGPVTRSDLNDWYTEERLTAECQILKEGADQWQWASDLFPDLEEQATAEEAAPAAAAEADDASPFGFLNTGGGGGGGPAVSTGGAIASGGTKKAATPTGGVSDKKKIVAGLLCLFLGNMGVHRFYMGYTGIGIAQLCLCGGCGIWSLIDLIMIFTGKLPDAKGRPLAD